MQFIRFVGVSLVVVVVVVLAACAWAFSVANHKYGKHWAIHDATFPIPWPLSVAELDSLKLARVAAGAKREDPLAGVDLEAVALERAVARGRHLVDSRVNCTGCHGKDFGGGVVINVPVVGYWAAPNLTTGEGGVTRAFTARDWDHAVRHAVRHDGHTSSMPCIEFANLSDHELSDIVAFVKSHPPVKRDVGPVRLGPVFAFVLATDPKALSAYVIDHDKPHSAEPPTDGTAAMLGEHIAQVCKGCHGPNLSGGKLNGDPDMPIVGNLTPHETGLKTWSEADFIRALRTGKRPNGTAISEQMPWKVYGQMSDGELAAVYAYLRTVPPRLKGNH